MCRAERILSNLVRLTILAGLIVGTYGSSWAESGPARPNCFPLQVGNSWTYSSGRTETITDTALIDGNVYYRFDRFLFSQKETPLLRMDEWDQIVEYTGHGFFGRLGREAVRYRFSVDERDAWLWSWPFLGKKGWLYVVRARGTDETVTVPAGTFTGCLHLKYEYCVQQEGRNWEEWLAPGVGSVKRIARYTKVTFGDLWPFEEQIEELVHADINGIHYPGDADVPVESDICWDLPFPETDDVPGRRYFPLEVGNRWAFRRVAVDLSEEEVRIQSIVGTDVVEGEIYYRFDNNLTLFAQGADLLFRADERGRAVEYVDGKEVVRYRSPLHVDEHWVWPLDVRFIIIVRRVDETVTVPAGTFDDCMYLEYIGGQDDGFGEWLCPGVGPVRFYRIGFDGMSVYELIEAKVGGVLYPGTPGTSVEPNTWGGVKNAFH